MFSTLALKGVHWSRKGKIRANALYIELAASFALHPSARLAKRLQETWRRIPVLLRRQKYVLISFVLYVLMSFQDKICQKVSRHRGTFCADTRNRPHGACWSIACIIASIHKKKNHKGNNFVHLPGFLKVKTAWFYKILLLFTFVKSTGIKIMVLDNLLILNFSQEPHPLR
jgi:hypothetical protein